MKITSFYPMIITKDQGEFKDLFEELGFAKKHEKDDVEGVNTLVMADSNDFRLDITQTDAVKQEKVIIRVNVDNLDEAHDLFAKHNFKDVSKMINTKSAKSIGMSSPSGILVALIQHIKDHD